MTDAATIATLQREIKEIKGQLETLMDFFGVNATPERSRIAIQKEVSAKLQKLHDRSKRNNGRAKSRGK